MNLSIILILSEFEKDNQKTLECLNKELGEHSIQLLVYGDPGKRDSLNKFISKNVSVDYVDTDSFEQENEMIAAALQKVKMDYVTLLHGGDVWSEGTLMAVNEQIAKYPQNMIMLKKIMPDLVVGAFAEDIAITDAARILLSEKMHCYPFYFGGTFIPTELIQKAVFEPKLGIDAERSVLLDLCAKKMQIIYIGNHSYFSITEREGNDVFYKGIYDPDWYSRSFSEFWIPFLEKMKAKYTKIPLFIQYHVMFSVRCRILSNLDNKNKHVIPEGEEENCLKLIGEVLQFVDDNVIFNGYKLKETNVTDSMKWIFGILKYGPEFTFQKSYLAGKRYYGYGDVLFNTIANLKTTISFMNYQDGRLEIDGLVHPILYAMADEVYMMFNGIKYPLQYSERYALTKVFGVSLYKSYAFHLSIPLEGVEKAFFFCFAKVNKEPIKIFFSYNSHFSRMSGQYENSYWFFGDKQNGFLVTKEQAGMLFTATTGKKAMHKQERKLSMEMFCKFSKRDWIFLGIRKAYFLAKPFMKRKPIWMYLDKIYKGGDSSEYLYRYASRKNNQIKHYYLVDKHATDYKRLKKDGFRPLVRGSIKHRLVFLMADMMVISNSTVFAFNDFGMANSSFVRDLVDFHVCCVQHGMSVQKIAVAQNRLRDNTRLYFCASEYEIENLSRPVYDYIGYDALRLTGVPRYDGLINDDKKQIMISPTWRMQAAVPVRTNEGQQREYNPLFKESTYYKVYNSLINDPRLIEAAKKYGYRIKYVLHPIVSSQVEDFDKNDYVDIIPAVGDMSYEKMFCESSLMVTDFSGIQFDFAYMRKPLVYLHHRDIPQHYEEGSFFYDTMAFGEICHDNDELIDLLCEYMATGCKMKEEYVRRADDFFFYDDHKNCERIYNEMIRYQERVIQQGPSSVQYELQEGRQYQINIEDRKACLQEIERILEENDETVIKEDTIADSYYNLNIRKKTVVMVGLGKNVRGNLQYILNELNHSDKYKGYKIYVRASEETKPVIEEYIEKNGWTRTQAVVSNKKYRDLLESAKYLITEVYFPESWVKKPGQVYINIWHGTPLKKLGLAKHSRAIHKDGTTQRNFIEADYLLYPNEYTRTHMLESYKVSDLMNGKAVMLGYPRTGGMLEALQSDLTAVKKQLAPNGEKIYAYMPTWKDYLKVEQVVAESKELLDYLDANLTDQQILYVNLHHKVSDSLDYSQFQRIKKFPPTTDSYVLLAASDALITDYSSVFYDYLATRKQIVLYCADYDLYRKERGTYMDLMELPFDKAVTKEEVLAALNRGKTYDDEEAFRTFCTFDSVDNAKRLCSLISQDGGTEAVVEPIPKTGKTNILVYSDSCEEGKPTRMLEELTRVLTNTNLQIYVGCEMAKVDENKQSAYPMLSNVPVIGTRQDPHLSAKGKAILKLYQENRVEFEKAMEYLQYDYYIALRRMFGGAEFAGLAIYDATDPEKIIELTMMPTRKLLFITSTMLDEIETGNQFLEDAVRFSMKYVNAVLSMSFDDLIRIRRIFDIYGVQEAAKLQVACSAAELYNVFQTVVNDR